MFCTERVHLDWLISAPRVRWICLFSAPRGCPFSLFASHHRSHESLSLACSSFKKGSPQWCAWFGLFDPPQQPPKGCGLACSSRSPRQPRKGAFCLLFFCTRVRLLLLIFQPIRGVWFWLFQPHIGCIWSCVSQPRRLFGMPIFLHQRGVWNYSF